MPCIAVGLFALGGFTANIKAQTDVRYSVYQLLSKDYNTIQQETHNGQDRIIITGIFPTGDEMNDASRVNEVFEEGIRQAPEQYLWTLQWFKNRPDNMPSPYI